MSGRIGSGEPGFHEEAAAAAGLSVARNPAGRWEWVLQFGDDVVLPSKRVSDDDYGTQEEALAAGEAARSRFISRRA